MTVKDLVLTPEGLLGSVEAIEAEYIDVRIANHATIVRYPKTAALPVVARAAEVERARAAQAGPAPSKEE